MNQEHKVERILVVDDQQANVQVLGGMLGQLGFEIVPVTSGEQALQRLAARPADLILLDALMPGMDGFEVCRRIRIQPDLAGIPIIFLSAADDKAFGDRGTVDGVQESFGQGSGHLACAEKTDGEFGCHALVVARPGFG